MKNLSFLCALFFAIFTSCNNDSDVTISNSKYDSLHFERYGSGQIDFTLVPTENNDQLNVTITKYNSKTTNLQLTLNKNPDNEDFFTTFQEALDGKYQIKGDFEQSKLATGTWAYIYLQSDDKDSEVTNNDLRNSLLEIEQIVKNLTEQ